MINNYIIPYSFFATHLSYDLFYDAKGANIQPPCPVCKFVEGVTISASFGCYGSRDGTCRARQSQDKTAKRWSFDDKALRQQVSDNMKCTFCFFKKVVVLGSYSDRQS